MKFVKNDLPSELQNIEIELFYDCHIGSPKCDYKLLQQRVERVKNNHNVYAIIGGDVINNSTKTSVGDVYEEELTPMQQIKHAVTLFEPIKDKILCVTSGNHCARSYKTDGVDLLHFMCAELGITSKYDFTACLCFVRFGVETKHKPRKICYSIYVSHGSGINGRTIGAKANGLERRGQIVDADIVVTGHTHQGLAFRTTSYKVNYQNFNASLKEQVFVNASATLDWESYAETYGMKPTSKINPVIILDGSEKKIVVKA